VTQLQTREDGWLRRGLNLAFPRGRNQPLSVSGKLDTSLEETVVITPPKQRQPKGPALMQTGNFMTFCVENLQVFENEFFQT
jgi:hypothetical protein